MTSTTAGPPVTRHERFYYENVVYRVENTLFKVPRYKFEALSPVFSDMFSSKSIEGDTSSAEKSVVLEGESDEHPIFLDGYKSLDFQRLLAIILPSEDWIVGDPAPLTTQDEWTSVLKLATIWDMKKIRSLAITKLSQLCLSSTEKIRLAREYRVEHWLKEGIREIVTTSGTVTTCSSLETLAGAIGWETAARVMWLIHTYKQDALPEKKVPISGNVQIPLSEINCMKDGCNKGTDPCDQKQCGLNHPNSPNSALDRPVVNGFSSLSSSAFGSSSVGPNAFGPSSVGPNAFGSSSVGSNAFGSSSVGPNAFGSSSVGSNAFGSSSFGPIPSPRPPTHPHSTALSVEVEPNVSIEWAQLRNHVLDTIHPVLPADAIDKTFQVELKELAY